QWGERIRSAYPGHTGPRPKLQIWHGGADRLINPVSVEHQRNGWTNVFGVSATPTSTTSPKAGVIRSVYGTGQVETWLVQNMGHTYPVDPGSATDQCGTSSAGYDLICGPYHAARFFGLDRPGGTPTPTPTPTPTSTPTATPTPSPAPSSSPPPAPACFTATNRAHVDAGRARQR
nr:feruloyl esterase [Micromonospora sp. DSM 115978]